MKEEYFDIVDENNNPIGEKKPRSEVHSLGFWHRVVHIYLFRQRNNLIEFLVHLRSKNKDSHPNCWDPRFGGHLKSGQNWEDAAMSELEEETGLKVESVDLIEGPIIKTAARLNNNEFDKVFYYKYDDEISKLLFNDGEVQNVKWMSVNDILDDLGNNKVNWVSNIIEFTKISEYLENKVKEKSPSELGLSG